MSRPLRIAHADTFYHILARGNDRRPVFAADRDHVHFVELLQAVCERFELEVWSYVLMPNHYHLLVRTRRANLSVAMQWLGVSYTAWFNAKHRRSGHLFQGRFKSFIVEEEDYLQRLILYIHRNPLRAKLVRRLVDYPWSSYRHLAYERSCPPWLARSAVLSLFNADARAFREAVQAYSEEEDRLLENLRESLFLGSPQGIDCLRKKLTEQPHREKPQFKALAPTPELPDSALRLAGQLKLSSDQITQWRRPAPRTTRPQRDLLIYCLHQLGWYSCRQIADYFRVSSVAVLSARRRAEDLLRVQKGLRKRVEKCLKLKVKM